MLSNIQLKCSLVEYSTVSCLVWRLSTFRLTLLVKRLFGVLRSRLLVLGERHESGSHLSILKIDILGGERVDVQRSDPKENKQSEPTTQTGR
jgi:hypothetical protein